MATKLQTKVIQVAAGIICRKLEINDHNNPHINTPESKQFLISLRHRDLDQGGLWEFPGGKIEANETSTEALCRELKEELDIEVTQSKALFEIQFEYPDKHVCLHIHLITEFNGQEKGKENQQIQWITAKELGDYEFPEANQPIIEYIINQFS